MRLRYRFVAALGTIVPACAAPSAHRGRAADHSATPPGGEAGPDATATTVATSTEPAKLSADAGPRPLASAGSTTTITVTVPTTPKRTTTTFVMPEAETDEDEWTARDATTARVSWYGAESGSHTANGDRYDPAGLTFAHRTLPFGTRVRFAGPLGTVVATCTDRGPAAWTGRTFDLSRGAFTRVAPLSAGVAELAWEVVG